MGKRHPSEIERLRAVRFLTMMKEKMPSCNLKQSLAWKDHEEARVLVIVTHTRTFCADLWDGALLKEHGLRMHVLMPSTSHPFFEASLGIIRIDDDGKISAIPYTQFTAGTGCSCGLELASKVLRLSHEAPIEEVVDQTAAFLQGELEEIMGLLLEHKLSPASFALSSKKDIDRFMLELAENGFQVQTPAWLKMPLRPDENAHSANPVDLFFDTTFEGFRASGGALTCIQTKVVLTGVVRMRVIDRRIYLKVGAKPALPHDPLDEFSNNFRQKTDWISKKTSKDGLSRLILTLMEEIVLDVYHRSQRWSSPIIWRQTWHQENLQNSTSA